MPSASAAMVEEYDDPEEQASSSSVEDDDIVNDRHDDFEEQDDDDSDTLSYVDGGCYFPQCFGGVTILYAVFAAMAVTVLVPAVEEQEYDASSTTLWWSTDLFVALTAFLLGVQLCRRSNNPSAAIAFTGWSVGFLVRGVLAAVVSNTTDSSTSAITIILYYIGTAISYTLWTIALFFILQVVTESWKTVKFTILEEQGLAGVKSLEHSSILSWINVARAAFSLAAMGGVVVLGGSAWMVLVEWMVDNDSSSSQSSDNVTSTIVQVGQGMVASAYLVFFMAAAILWGLHARYEEVFLTDFFLPPQVAVSGMLWCMILSAVYRIVLLIVVGSSDDADTTTTTSVNDILAPLLLQYMTLATMVCCHNLILTFFADDDEQHGDTDDESYYGGMAEKKSVVSHQSLKEVQLSFDEELDDKELYDNDQELNKYIRPGEEILGFHYELDNNSLEDDDANKAPKRRRSFGFRRNRSSADAATNFSTDAIKVLFGDNNKDSFEIDDDEDEELGKIAANGHVYGKYDSFIFGQDAQTNISMLPKKEDGTPDLAGFDRRSKMDKELEEQEAMLNPVDFIKSLSILPTTGLGRDDDGSIESAEDQNSLRSNPSAIKNRSSPSRGIAMDGQVRPNNHEGGGTEEALQQGNEDTGHHPAMGVTVADFMKALSPWTPASPNRKKKEGKTRKAFAALDVSREFNEGIQAVASTLSEAASGCMEKGLKKQQRADASSTKQRSNAKTPTDGSDSNKTAPVSLEANPAAPTSPPGPSVFESVTSAMQNVDNLWTSWMNTAAADAATSKQSPVVADSAANMPTVRADQPSSSQVVAANDEHSEQSSRHLPFRSLNVSKTDDEESLRFQDDEIGSFANDGYYEDVIVLDANGKPTLGPNVRNLVQYWDLGKANADGQDIVKNTNHAVVRTRTVESKTSKRKSRTSSALGSLKRGMRRMGSRTRSRSRSRSKSPIYEDREDNVYAASGNQLRKVDSRDTDVGMVVHRY